MEIAELRDEIVAADAKSAFDLLSGGFSAEPGFEISAHEQGFLNSLRIYRGGDFCFALVPNDEWVLAYVRKPELQRARLTADAVMAAFPEARRTKQGEITLRIRDTATAARWFAMIQSAG